jgi:phosphoenolpyruvate carboxykinase (ATP)
MSIDLSVHGIHAAARMHRNLSPAALYEESIRRGECVLGADGQLIANTAPHTGRSPGDKFIVCEPSSEMHVGWGDVNRPFDEPRFTALKARVCEHLGARDVFVQDAFGGADPRHRLPIRVVTEKAWSALFARTMFVRPSAAELERHEPEFTILHAPEFQAVPARDGTSSANFVIIHLGERMAIIGGTKYAGEVKKTIFSVLNYYLPLEGVLSMHCSANIGRGGDAALFFGLSGTGKTTLSADPERRLIGDDEHGWSDAGIFNFEGGCYAKVINLSREQEPEIWAASHRFGTVLENVVYDEATRALALESEAITENTRSAYPLPFIPNVEPSGQGAHPRNVVFLTCDAFGVLPPIARLTPEQAMYHFLSGYTAKVAGTEKGVTEPKATFSTCFGAPFMTLPPGVYAKLLGEKLARHGSACWLVNTGWTAGPYGVGRRLSIGHTRALVRAALSGALAETPTVEDPLFGLRVPTGCDGVPPEVLRPRDTWADKAAYDAKARELAGRFASNFEKYAAGVSEAIQKAGPRG